MVRRAVSAFGVIEADCALAGLVVALLEGGRIAVSRHLTASDLPGLLLVVAGLSLLAAAVAGPALVLLLRMLAAVPFLAAWWSEARDPGERRVAAILRAFIIVLAAAAFAVFTFRFAEHAQAKYKAARAIAMLEAGVLTALGLTLAVTAGFLARLLVPLLAARQVFSRATRGLRGWGVAAVAVAAICWVLVLIVRAEPAADFRPHLTAASFVAALLAARVARLGQRLRGGGRAALLIASALIIVATLGTVGRLATARGRVSSDGTISRHVLGVLKAVSDGDHDGFTGRFGGLDCDDSDARVNPMAREIVGNGRDDNCTGGDLRVDDIAARARPQPTSYPRPDRRPNVILLSIDALRTDHMGVGGYARPTTPRLDALAARATFFSWAISPSPTTRRAIPSLMSSRYCSAIAWKKQTTEIVVEIGAQEMLGETFAAAGYETRAIHCCDVLFDKHAGVVEGFKRVDATASKFSRQRKYSADQVAQKIVAFLGTRKPGDAPFFLWSHFIDPHNPYIDIPGAPVFGKQPIDKYDSEVAFVDKHIGLVLAAIEASHLREDTIIAVIGDHGDEFKEHGNQHHARSLYNEVMRVPFIMAIPGGTPRIVPTPVSLVDVGPTLLDLAGIDRPAGQNGISLGRTVRDGHPPPDRAVLGELIADGGIKRNLIAAYAGEWKLIWDLDVNTYELYSLTRDPGDRSDVQRTEIDVLLDMERRLHAAMDRELAILR